MNGLLLILILTVLIVYGGYFIPVVFLHLPVMFVVIAVLLAASKVVDLFKAKRP